MKASLFEKLQILKNGVSSDLATAGKVLRQVHPANKAAYINSEVRVQNALQKLKANVNKIKMES